MCLRSAAYSILCFCMSNIMQHCLWPLWGCEGLVQMTLWEKEDTWEAVLLSSLLLWCGPIHPKRQKKNKTDGRISWGPCCVCKPVYCVALKTTCDTTVRHTFALFLSVVVYTRRLKNKTLNAKTKHCSTYNIYSSFCLKEQRTRFTLSHVLQFLVWHPKCSKTSGHS